MQKAKEESTDSIKIMQEHNQVVDFLKHKLQNIEGEINQQKHSQQLQLQLQEKVKKEINEFVTNLRNHFSEEEQIVFPLTLKADSSYLNYNGQKNYIKFLSHHNITQYKYPYKYCTRAFQMKDKCLQIQNFQIIIK